MQGVQHFAFPFSQRHFPGTVHRTMHGRWRWMGRAGPPLPCPSTPQPLAPLSFACTRGKHLAQRRRRARGLALPKVILPVLPRRRGPHPSRHFPAEHKAAELIQHNGGGWAGLGDARRWRRQTYLFVFSLAVWPLPRVIAGTAGTCTFPRLLILLPLLLLLLTASGPLRVGDGLRARRNSLHIHLHLPVRCLSRQKQTGILSTARRLAGLLLGFPHPLLRLDQEAVARMALSGRLSAPIRRLQFSPRASRLLHPACVLGALAFNRP